jgi:hypothetical protein
MKKFKAWRYKCDFCGKNGRSGRHMRNHEFYCTSNPNRICRVHAFVTGNRDDAAIHPVAPLIEALRSGQQDGDHGLARLREAAEDCPACILAAIRQSGLCRGYGDEEGYTPPAIGQKQFDFKKEMAEIFNSKNVEDCRDYAW